MSGQKSDTGSYIHLISSDAACYPPLLINPSHFPKWLFANGPARLKKLVYAPSTYLWGTMVDGIFYILADDLFTFLLGLPRPSQKRKSRSQYEIVVSFYRNMYGPFILNTSSRISRLFWLNSPVSLIPQGLLCQIPSRACLCCVAPCF